MSAKFMTGYQMSVQRREKGSSITRVLEIIEAISLAERPISPAELAFLLDIPKSSLHRLLQQLEADNYLQINMRGLLLPGNRMHNIALGALHSRQFKALRKAILKNLAETIGETCGIGIPDGNKMVYYDRVQTNWPLRIHLPVGSHTPVWSTASGKLYLSSLPKERRQRIIDKLPLNKLARNTLTDPFSLERDLLKTQASELGTDNEEFIDGMVACAVPIKDKDGKLFACLFTHAPVFRKNLAELLEFEPLLRQAAIELENLIKDDHPTTT